MHAYNKELKEEHLFGQALKDALEKGEFRINFQPIVDKNRRPYLVEALLRWESPEFGTVMPMDFIPIIEKNKYIVNVGE